jgi:hypothetical protein
MAALAALSVAGHAAPAPEEKAVLASVNALLDSWRQGDSAKSDRVLHKDFRLTTYQGEGADRRVNVEDRASLMNTLKHLPSGVWDDRLKDVRVRVGSNGLAIVTARYLFSAGGKPSHCGLVAMQLYREADEWRIISFSDTHNNLNGRSEAEVCPA